MNLTLEMMTHLSPFESKKNFQPLFRKEASEYSNELWVIVTSCFGLQMCKVKSYPPIMCY